MGGPGGARAGAEEPAGAAAGLGGLRALGPPALAAPLPQQHRTAAARRAALACEHGPPLCPLCWRGVPSPDSAFPAAGNQPRCALLVGGQEVSPPTDVRPQQCECTEMWGRGELLVGSGHGSGQSCSRNLNGLRSMQDERRLHPPLYCRTPTWHTWRLLPTSWLTPTGCHPAVTGWPRGMCSATRCCHPSCPRMGATSPRWRAWKRWRRLWVRLLHVCVPKA